MITITKILIGGKSKLSGEIGENSYCITFNESIYNTLQKLSKEVEICTNIKEYNSILEKANNLVQDNPLYLEDSKYFTKINEDFFLTDGKKYYHIVDNLGIANRIFNYYLDKGLNLDKFASFIAREGSLKLLEIENIYHLLNKSGNIFCNVSTNLETSHEMFFVDLKTNTILTKECAIRYFRDGHMIKSNSFHSLKSLGINVSKIVTQMNDNEHSYNLVSMLIRPDLQCYIGDLSGNNGIIIDPDNECDWDRFILSFINKYGK